MKSSRCRRKNQSAAAKTCSQMLIFQGWLAEVEERMPSKSDTHRKSGLYETQNSTITATTVSNNCAQDRERYGIPEKTHTSKNTNKTQTSVTGLSLETRLLVFSKHTSGVCVCVLTLEQPGWQLHRGAELGDSGQGHSQPHLRHARV